MKNILSAEDDSDFTLIFEEALNELDIDSKLTVAKNGEELMDTLEETVPPSPSVIFLDLNMPKKDGIECLSEIRSSSKLKNIPVVIFSTSTNPKNIEKTYELGANFYLCKPNKFENLKQAILKILSLSPNIFATPPNRNEYFLNAV